MAIKPNDGETFLREVDEELRKERMQSFVSRYGWWILAALVLLIAAVGGYIWWQDRQREQAAEQAAALLTALDSIEAGNPNAAAPTIEALAESDIEGYRVAALFARASAEAEAGNADAAAATLGTIAGDGDLADPYRNAALVRQTQLQFDRMPPAEVVRRLQPLAQPGNPFFGSAGEMVGIALMKLGRHDRAGRLFARIGRDETVPDSIRTRAIQMAGSLGVDALPEPPGAEATATPAPPAAAATEEESE